MSFFNSEPQEPNEPAYDDIYEGTYEDEDEVLEEDFSFLSKQAHLVGRSAYREANRDALFGMLLAGAIAVGLIPMLPANIDFRYTLAWGVMAGFSVLGWLLGNASRINEEKIENLAWGAAFGVLLSLPFILFGLDILASASKLMFAGMGIGTILAYLIFVQPLAETLFFRGQLQNQMPIIGVIGAATLWQAVLFLPVMWGALIEGPAVAIVILLALLIMNTLYSYVQVRNGLAAAWVCQIVVGVGMWFIPLLI